MRKIFLPLALTALIVAFWLRPDVQEIAAGVAIFLFGMLMLEDGFKLFGGGFLERVLTRATKTTPRALVFGILSTTALQSSSLVSVITISFLSAGMITLLGGLGVIFGANIGTTTGAWLVAGFGLKVNISAYAMPMIAVGIVLVFQNAKALRGIGFALGGLGFLFLGIHYMKEGFESFQDQIDLTQFAMTGFIGLVVYTLMGAVATVIMQSSHATMVLIITALAAGQITYENALALAIGANIGTTVTAILGAIGANYQGRRLALGHLVFNVATAAVALVLIAPLRDAVDWVSALVGIAPDDYALKLAVFHTIFNMLGVGLMLPVMGRLVPFLEHRIPEPVPTVSQPHYLTKAVEDFPQTLETALRQEVLHLYANASELILHGLNLHRHDLRTGASIADTVSASRSSSDLNLEAQYEQRVKSLYAAIVEYAARAGRQSLDPETTDRIHVLRDVAGYIVQAVKSVKHLRKNVERYTTRDKGKVTELYDTLRTEIARIVVEIDKLEEAGPDARSALWLDQESAQVEEDASSTSRRIDVLIRSNALNPLAATSFLNDASYGYDAMRDLITAARAYYGDRDTAMAQVEKLLSIDEDDVDDRAASQDTRPRNTPVTDRGDTTPIAPGEG